MSTTETPPGPEPMICGRCGKAKPFPGRRLDGAPKLPFRWTRDPETDALVCPECKETPPVRNYLYGAKAPAGPDREVVDDQMRLAAAYRNARVAVELERRRRVDEAVVAAVPAVAEVEQAIAAREAELAAVRGEIRAGNSRARRKTRGTPTQREAAAERDQALRELWARRAALRRAAFADPAVKVRLKAVDAWVKAEHKRVYNEDFAALYWGTKSAVDQATRKLGSGPPPDYVRFRGDGHIAVQVQGGAAADAVTGGLDQYVRVRSLGDHPRKPHAVLSLRVGTVPGGRAPVWVHTRFRLHRPLPPGSRVKSAHLLRTRVGVRDRWEVMFSVAGAAGPVDRAAAGQVGVDVGWRRLPGGGLRVAVWAGDDGRTGELVLPPAYVADARRAEEEVQSTRKRLFNAMLARVVAWAAEHPLPAAWTTPTAADPHPPAHNLAQWESHGRLWRLAAFWRAHRLPGDAAILGAWAPWRTHAPGAYPTWAAHHAAVRAAAETELTAWVIQDLHLLEVERGLVARTKNYRREQFRLLACRLRRAYRTVAVEDIDWTEDVLRKPVAECDDRPDLTKAYHRMGAPGTLVRILTEQAAVTDRVPPFGTTVLCHVCGGRCEFDRRRVRHTCEHCGAEWDQDYNAARNLLERRHLPPTPEAGTG